jgi:NAD(P)-dependent dehydrogenase (short-subunit alcohol dehydrogenase family)
MNQDFAGKVALITGGNSGIGRSTALLFARKGAKTVIAARRMQAGEETVRLLNEAGGEAIFVPTDVSKATEVAALVDKTMALYGRLDYAFNNAGVIEPRPFKPITECSEEEWDQVMNINLKGVWLGIKYQIPAMLKGGGGSIVNMSSIFGLLGAGSCGAYAASKHAVIGLTKSVAKNYARQGIRVNAICPAFIDTPMVDFVTDNPDLLEEVAARHPIGRLGTPQEIAEAVVWLCSDAASFVTGHALVADGGYLA